LIAEEVAEVNPDLVVRDEKGEIYTGRLRPGERHVANEFLKEHGRLEEQQATIADLKSTVANSRKAFSPSSRNKKANRGSGIGSCEVNAQLESIRPDPQWL
jgi:hypothetical protein